MSNYMNWNQFLTEYMLRAMSNYQMFDEYNEKQMVEFARRVWDAMQAVELPESEKAKPIPSNSGELKSLENGFLIPTTKEQLKSIAEYAASHNLKWIAQDKFNGMWYGYAVKPQFEQSNQEWQAELDTHYELIELFDNIDYSKQLFQVSQILSDNE